MIPSAILNKGARLNFSKTNKTARLVGRVQFLGLLNLPVLLYSKLHQKNYVITS